MIRLAFGWFILFFFALGRIALAQISEGGIPMKTAELKSSRGEKVEMPSYMLFFKSADEEVTNENRLKSFYFAHPFEVNFTTSNSGEWYKSQSNYVIWKLTIRSEGAYSINLIFDDFELPEGAKLFVFSETEEYILGAYTHKNNNKSGKFAISPVAGDEITVQFEVPENLQDKAAFRIVQVNHDFTGILKASDRRPLGKIAGTCNIDINCESWDDWSEVKNSVVRMIVNGVEVCSGVLVNNTAENKKPYVLSAAHCYDKPSYAQTTVFAFNYESPFCKPLDGDPSNSISGAVMKAHFDSLDFALVEMETIPPPVFQPYYAGWNRDATEPIGLVSIHHPQGDVKKLASDKDAAIITNFNSSYTKNGFLKITRWDYGVTEAGSSGAPFFDQNKLIRGTLTGGEASCRNPVNDYCNRFALAWEFKTDSAKQLKYWLDPLKTNPQMLEGKQFNTDENLCGTINNLTDNDAYSMIPALNGTAFAGYWGGSNNLGITEVVEKFTTDANLHLQGVSLGVAKFKNVVKNSNSEIVVKVYNGFDQPDDLVYAQTVKTSPLAVDALNYIKFNEVVHPLKNFFVGFELTNIQPLDSFAVYQSMRTATDLNSVLFKKNDQWVSFRDLNAEKKAMANIIELVACNIDDLGTDTPHVNNPADILVFPNPVQSKFILEAGQDITSEALIEVFNLLGQKSQFVISRVNERKMEIDLTGNIRGIYFIRFKSDSGYITHKVSFVPW